VSDATIIVAIFAAAVLFVVWQVSIAYRRRNVRIRQALRLPFEPQEAMARVSAQAIPLMQYWGYHVAAQSPVGLTFTRTYRPMWLVLPCVFLFPIGLLFLLYTKTVDISFTFVSAETGAETSVAGAGPPDVKERIDDILSELQVEETALAG
jgi:hypothetical protein